VNDELVHAIGGKYLVEFVYKAGRTRIVEPHDYGIRRPIEQRCPTDRPGRRRESIR